MAGGLAGAPLRAEGLHGLEGGRALRVAHPHVTVLYYVILLNREYCMILYCILSCMDWRAGPSSRSPARDSAVLYYIVL